MRSPDKQYSLFTIAVMTLTIVTFSPIIRADVIDFANLLEAERVYYARGPRRYEGNISSPTPELPNRSVRRRCERRQADPGPAT